MRHKQPKKPHRTETQHYVPQFYLRGFTNDTGRMFCYDKVAERSHPTSTEAAAQEPYFYEIPPGSFRDHNVPVNTIETALNVVEMPGPSTCHSHQVCRRRPDPGRSDD